MRALKYFLFAITLIVLPWKYANAEFNISELDVLCEHISSDKKQCLIESKYLKKRSLSNGIESYCQKETRNISSFYKCMTINTNPLHFLKYKKHENLSLSQQRAVNIKLMKYCDRTKENKITCLSGVIETMDAIRDKNNWIEIHCLTESKNENEIKTCKNSLTAEAKSYKGLLSNLPILNNTLISVLDYYKTKKAIYLSQISNVCYEKYGESDLFYECTNKVIEPIKKELFNLETKNLPCFKSDTLLEFKTCLNKK